MKIDQYLHTTHTYTIHTHADTHTLIHIDEIQYTYFAECEFKTNQFTFNVFILYLVELKDLHVQAVIERRKKKQIDFFETQLGN